MVLRIEKIYVLPNLYTINLVLAEGCCVTDNKMHYYHLLIKGKTNDVSIFSPIQNSPLMSPNPFT